ncbi:hypothetical protein D3C72_1086740 [compost metagenome]
MTHRVVRQNVLHLRSYGGQIGHGLPFEHLARRDLPPCLAQARHNLQAKNRVAAQFKEVVVTAHLRRAQDLRPDGGKGRFDRAFG